MSEDPVEPLVRLGKLLQKEAEELGLQLATWAILPNFSGDGPHIAQAVFVLPVSEDDGEPPAVDVGKEMESARDDPAQAEFDAQFEELMHAEKRADEDQAMQERAAQLAKMAEELEQSKGIFPED